MNKLDIACFATLFIIFSTILYCAFFAPEYLGTGEGFGYAIFTCIVGMLKYVDDIIKKL